MKYISSKRQQFYALHHHNDTTLSAVSSKIQYWNDCYADWLAEEHHVAHIEVSGPIFGGAAEGHFCCYDAMANGSLTPMEIIMMTVHGNALFLVILLLMEQ